MGTTTSSGLIFAPSVPQPQSPSDLVGLTLRSVGGSASPAGYVSFGQGFAQGQLFPGSGLSATVGGVSEAAQLAVLSTWPDGSVRMAQITLQQPAIAAGGSVGVMLSTAPAPTAPAVSLSNIAAGSGVVVNLGITSGIGAGSSVTLDSAALLAKALANGTAQIVQSGPLASEAIVQTTVAGSLRVVFDITRYADGRIATDVAFDNDIAMQASGGAVTYNVGITRNGTTLLQQNGISQIQYTSWHYQDGITAPAAVVHDEAYLQNAGLVPNYDLANGVSSSLISQEASTLASPGYGAPLSAGSVDQYMPGTGGRPDIGPQPQWNAAWLMSQDPSAAQFAMVQANVGGSVPWSFYDAAHGTYVSLSDYPNLWLDPRGGPGSYTTGLTQPVSGSTGWTTDSAHQPDLAYVAYLNTGNSYYLDLLNAQASWAVANLWPTPRNGGQGIDVSTGNQVRGAAWDLRQIVEAAAANPDGSAEKTYFTQIENNNFQYLLNNIPTWTQEQGSAYGYLPGSYQYSNELPPWQQDYFASSVIEAARLGNADAVSVLKWESNFLVGRFLNAGAGFNPRDGLAYNLIVTDSNGNPYTSWAAIENATQAAGMSNGSGWAQSNGDYGQLALQTLAGIITVLHDPNAIKAYAWLVSSGAPYVSQQAFQNDPTFSIAPILPDGMSLAQLRPHWTAASCPNEQ